MLSKAIFLVAACSLVGQTSAEHDALSYNPSDTVCSKDENLLDPNGVTVTMEMTGFPGQRVEKEGVEGMYDDNCGFWELEPESNNAIARNSQAANNPNNPAAFCGRPMGDTGPFDPYFLTPGAPVPMAMSASSPPPITYMEIAFPGYTTVTVNGVTGVLDQYCNMPEPSASGDPHFKTWGGDRFDFHGGCDLVLVKNEYFANGKGFNIHIRTHIKTWWSYIEAAVVQIGDNTMEISGAEGGWIWLNGEKDGHGIESGDAALGGYSIHSKRINEYQTTTRIDLGDNNAISIETFKHFVRVNLKPKTQASFYGSTGLLGSFPEGKMVARDGVTIMEDTNEYGQEWMVHPSEPMLFHDFTASEHPLQCTMPDQEQKKEARRRLGELAITEMDAAQACARVTDGVERDLCIFDVMATNDKDIAGSY